MVNMLLTLLVLGILVTGIVCPPVNPQPVEGDSEDDDPGFGLEYDRYLKEVVMALEEDSSFREKLEQMNISDIKSFDEVYTRFTDLRKVIFTDAEGGDEYHFSQNGKIALHLDLVSHHIRERLDEIKRQEIQRLRELALQKIKAMNGTQVMKTIQHYGGIQKMDQEYPHHVDVKNPHSFEMKDLENLIKKATSDLDEIDRKRKGEFKDYEMRKEHERQEELKDMDAEHKKAEEEHFEQMQQKHKEHPKVHHPGSKDQLEDVWEKTDHLDPEDFDPKTFFKMHDIDGNGLLDQEEIEALFQKELDRVYDPNMPEDDMRERYEEMARMREHVFTELDTDGDKMISIEEFLNYTASQEFEKDEGWKTVDEQQAYTDEEFQRYEQMLREREGLDPNMQPGVVHLPQDPNDPNVQHMQMPQEGMPPHQQQQLLHDQQQQQLYHEKQQQLHHEQQQQIHHEQQQQLNHEQQQQLHHEQQQQQLHQQQPIQQQQHIQGMPPGGIPQGIPQGMPPGGIPQGMPPGGIPQGMPHGGPNQDLKLPQQVPGGQPVNVPLQGQVPQQQGQGQNDQALKFEGQQQQQPNHQPVV